MRWVLLLFLLPMGSWLLKFGNDLLAQEMYPALMAARATPWMVSASGTGYTVDGERLRHGLRWHGCLLNCSASLI